MSDHLIKRVVLTEEKMKDKESMASFMRGALDLPDYFGGNLDALADLLSEIREETVFEVEECELERIPEGGYAAKTLHVLCMAADDNPHLHLYLTSGF
jgi:RNAse (barnase) inhibitor barstar